MKEAAQKLRAVYNTVEQLKIDATFDNTNKVLGILQTLEAVIRELERPAEEPEDEEEDDYEPDADAE